YAKSTKHSENIALEEDDGYAILARRFLEEHAFFKEKGRVIVFTKQGSDGEITLASGSVPKSNTKALTTLSTLYDLLKELGFDLDPSMNEQGKRPTSATLDESYNILTDRIDEIMQACGDIRTKLEAQPDAKLLRNPKDKEGEGHPFMRPMIQKAIMRAINYSLSQGIDKSIIFDRLKVLDWEISESPWNSVAQTTEGRVKMLTGRDYVNVLDSLLRVHLCPASKSEIKKARKAYKDLRGLDYSVSDEMLQNNLAKT
ncbi:MAG: DNA sulfur modification protein DndB, partial [Magnetococcales bacterium]|nr:DNA sulfur modification protein DndB [Magnetococcales bacterium]